MGLFNYPTGQPDPTEGYGTLGFTFLEHLDQQGWKKVLTHAETVNFTVGQLLIRAGDIDAAFYILTRGSVAVILPGRDTQLTTIAEGSVFGEISFFDGEPNSASIRAETDGRAIRMTRAGFEQLNSWDPALGRRILFQLGRILAMRLRHTTPLAQR